MLYFGLAEPRAVAALEESPFFDKPQATSYARFDLAEANRLLDGTIALGCPVRLLHGQRDADVPWETSLRLAQALASEGVRIHLVKDGDHRLSRPQDIALLERTVDELLEGATPC